MQQVRKPKRAARSEMIAGKPARSRRSAEHKLVELKQWLREISDLNAASDILNWDQATYMPEGGAVPEAVSARRSTVSRTRGRSNPRSAANRRAGSLGESLPYDSDDASLIRVARREYQKKIKVPPDHVARATVRAPPPTMHGRGRGRPTTLRRW